MRVALIASTRFPIREPFAGGLEAHTWSLAHGLRARGHEVSVFAAPGSDPALGASQLAVRSAVLSEAARADVSSSPEWWMQEHHAYLSLMLELADANFDVVHNNSLHYLPVAMAASLRAPMVTTLHTPPTPWLESAIQAPTACTVTFAAVSAHTARAWAHVVPDAHVAPNGVDTRRWRQGPGGGPAVWYGRLVPEKGAHLAVQAAARAGVPLRLAGPVLDRVYYDEQVRPWLGPDIEHVGHLRTDELVELVGEAAVTLVTPCWEEPFGLVVAESLSCGTPVAGLARGALPELVDARHARLVTPGSIDALAGAMLEAATLSRDDARAHAVATCSDDAMVECYEQLYETPRPAAGGVIGWYVHGHGLGHLQRLQCVAPLLRAPVTGLSSLPRPAGFPGAWHQLPDDLPIGSEQDVTAGGTLHWAPRHHPRLLRRGAAVVEWVARARPAVVVVDVSVEVAVLVRSLGVPVVVAAMRGDRSDRAHRTAYDLADALLAPWPGSLPEPWPQSWLDKCWHVGGLSRLDGRAVSPAPGNRRVAVLWGRGGSDVSLADIDAARAATPGWTWDVLGLPGARWVADPWAALQAADVVVSHAGQNALAEVAAARRPAIVVPQRRPHGEQHANAAALDAGGLALVRNAWPAPEQWPHLLEQAAAGDGGRWSAWSDGLGARRAADLIDAAAVRLAA